MLARLPDVFRSLSARDVRYVVIGGIAAIVDVQTRTPGVQFPEAWRDRLERSVDGTTYWIASREHLIAMKKAAGRAKDLEDVAVLAQQEQGGS